MKNRICELFGVEYPIIQGGMVWCSGWRLASAVSNAGGLGLIGAGSMHPETLEEHIQKAQQATNKPFGVNVPLLYPEMDKIIEIIIRNKVKIVFTSAGSPKKFTKLFHEHGIKVAHVVSSSLFAKKCEDASVDAIVCEGFEAGGHNGREETTSLALVPEVRKATTLPLIAAGGFASGQSLLAAQTLGAEGVQFGSLFAVAKESSASDEFKSYVFNAKEGDTKLVLKSLAPVRMMKNEFFEQIHSEELKGASPEKLREILGKGRSKKGIFQGNLSEGELEIGQVSSQLRELKSVEQIFENLKLEYKEANERICSNLIF